MEEKSYLKGWQRARQLPDSSIFSMPESLLLHGNVSTAAPCPCRIAEQDIPCPGAALTLPLFDCAVLAFSWVQPCRQKWDWQKVNGGQDLLNFSSCVKSSLLLSADPLPRAGILICLVICRGISELWESKCCVPQKLSQTPLRAAGWVDTVVFFAGVSYSVEHGISRIGCLRVFIHFIPSLVSRKSH